jgi:hypothetical protein
LDGADRPRPEESMVNRRTIVAAVAAVLFCTTITDDALAARRGSANFSWHFHV